MSIVKRLAWYTAIVVSAIALLVLAWRVREPLMLFVLSLVLAAAFRPPIDQLVRRGWPRGVALGVTYLLSLGILSGLIYLIGQPLAWDLGDAGSYLARSYERAIQRWPTSPDQFERMLAAQLPSPTLLYAMLAGPQGSAMIQSALGFAGNLANTVSNLSLALVISVYWNADQVRFERLWLSLLPVAYRSEARDAWHDIEARIGAYIRSEVFIIVLVTAFVWIGFKAMEMPYAALLALFAALARLVPWLGIPLALIPPFLVGSIASPERGVLAALYTLLALLLLERGVKRRFFPQREYSSLLIGLTVVALAYTFGLGGAILGPFVAITIQLIAGHLLVMRARPAPAPQPAAIPLAEHLRAVRAQLAQSNEPPRPEIESLLERLDQLVNASQEYVK